MVLPANYYLNIFSLINIINKKIYRTLSLPGGCALAAIALAPASIILLFVAFEIMFGRHICLRKAVQFHHSQVISHKLGGE